MDAKRVPRVYLETSVWNFQFADDAEDKRDFTRQLFAEAREGRFELFSSDVVFRELSATRNDARRSLLLRFFAEVAPTLLDVTEQAVALSEEYIRAGAIPAKYANDALHLAIASVEEMDILLSWNMKHIVKGLTRRNVRGLNLLAGYHEIEISTPEMEISASPEVATDET